MTVPDKSDPRVVALAARELPTMPAYYNATDRADMANLYARTMIAKVEAAGLLVVADNEDTVERMAAAIQYAVAMGLIQSDSIARAVISSALRSNPPADQPEGQQA